MAGLTLDFVLYDFRLSFATGMAQNPVDLATLAAIFGQGSIRTVQKIRPSHRGPQEIRDGTIRQGPQAGSAKGATRVEQPDQSMSARDRQ
ncbi:MAG: hypothetical protein ACLPY1_12795 [Terracidiphilus sp.]